MKFTKREKILLYILACVVIFSAGLYLLILPAFENQAELIAEIDGARTAENEMKTKIQISEQIEERIIKTRGEVTALSSGLYGTMPNYEVDKIITLLLVKHNLRQSSLLITEPVQSGTESIFIVSRYVNIQIVGTMNDILGLISEVDSIQSIRLIAFYVDFEEEGIIGVSVNLEVFMYAANEMPE